MRVAVIGAGMTGLAAAYRLSSLGHRCDVYERWPGLGGQVATLDVGDGHLLERYYHHLFTSDEHIVELYEELGLAGAIEWRPSSVGMFARGRSHPFTTPIDLLRFPAVSIRSRLRMGAAVVRLQRGRHGVERYERITAKRWIEQSMGTEAWSVVWGPLLRGKFGGRADDISMAWLHSKLTLRRQIKGKQARRELLGYPRGGWQPLLERLRERIEEHSGRVLIDRPAARVSRDGDLLAVTPAVPGSFRRGHDPRSYEAVEGPERYHAVVATVPSDVFAGLLDDRLRAEIGNAYLGKLDSIAYHTALCLLLELDRGFSRFYWTNVADRDLPFVGVIEQTNFVEPERYGNRRFLYVANYLEPGNELLSLDPDELLRRYEPGLQQINASFTRDWVRNLWLFREPAAQPIVTVGYRERIPPLLTGARGLVLANTTQIYPEDRGTNYSVRLGGDAAAAVVAQAEPASPDPGT